MKINEISLIIQNALKMLSVDTGKGQGPTCIQQMSHTTIYII